MWRRLPYLQVTAAANVAPQVDAQYPAYGYGAPSLTPELLASAHDPDAGPSALTYDFLVYDATGASKLADSGWISARSWKIPAGTLRWGTSYLWTVVVKDGSATSTSQTANVLSTAVPQPLITSGLSQNGGQGFEPSVGNYTTSVTDAQVATVGPELAVTRSYNSQDPRTGGAGGAGWSSLVDARAVEQRDGTGAVQLVTVTYPGGQDVTFGRNSDGSFTSGAGRYSGFTAVSTIGYQLVDKDGTTYLFTTATPTGYGLTSVTDAQGRALTFGYDSYRRVVKLTSASGRALTLGWATPSGAGAAHVATVATDPVEAGQAGTALVWTYGYSADRLTRVCAPTSAASCLGYGYGSSSRYPSAVLNAGPRSYWRLGEAAGATAATSAVVGNQGTDNGTYTDVSLGSQAGPLPGSAGTAGVFNGSSSKVELPANLVAATSYQTVSLWFKAAAGAQGVLFSYQKEAVVPGASTVGNYTPALYIGTSGKLYGQFSDGESGKPITSSAVVTDGKWHQAVLSGAGTGQSLYLDGSLVGSWSRALQLTTDGATHIYVGAGFN